jgi:hypothetical protein
VSSCQALSKPVPNTALLAMTFNMTLPMVAWMRHRGHSWRVNGEMAGAMFVLDLALHTLFWAGLVSDDVVLPLEMALMIPTTFVVMAFRFDEYAGHSRLSAPSP